MQGNSRNRNRRYYLHRKIKGIIPFDAYSRTLYISQGELDQLGAKQAEYFLELTTKYKYSAQHLIE